MLEICLKWVLLRSGAGASAGDVYEAGAASVGSRRILLEICMRMVLLRSGPGEFAGDMYEAGAASVGSRVICVRYVRSAGYFGHDRLIFLKVCMTMRINGQEMPHLQPNKLEEGVH
ncbi:hypothetical protein [Rossellomorea aquimaris]|uniref:Uncharacterized protein n=1 Tax=Rossellomorea aquimaris TaxID=189382 RepID=A0A5D4UAF0_9BACI|nr:hypothetical protein [Rossellomorea aquimaris]TYS84068.1 hypothetical protein FZC80_00895 [Rossellomorea aquimaris]